MIKCKNYEICNNEITDGKRSAFCKSCRSALGKRNKRKGAANEHRFSKRLQEVFDRYALPYSVRRTPRSGGIREFESSDLMFRGIDSESILNQIHFELKNTQHLYLEDWMNEALKKENDSGKNRNPIIVHRKPNSTMELATLDVEFLIQMMVIIEKYRRNA